MIRFLQRHKGARGSVTILMLIIMLPMLVFSFTIVDVCKIFMAQDVTAEASQLALNAGMTSYDKVLKDMYGILATSKTEDELSEKMSKYYAATLAAHGLKDSEESEKIVLQLLNSIDGVNKEAFKKDSSYLRVDPEKLDGKYVAVNAFDSSAASNPAVLERQIIEYMKYRGPVNMASGMLDKLNALKDLPNQAEATTKRIEFEQDLSSINNNAIDAYTLFQLYYYNNKRAEGAFSDFSIVHQNEKEDLIGAYLYSGGSVNAGSLFQNDELKKIECRLKSASLAVMFYAPFYDSLRSGKKIERNNLGDTSFSSVSSLTDTMKNMMDKLDAYQYPQSLEFEDILDGIENGKEYADAFCNFNAASWTEPSDTDTENALKAISGVWLFSKLYRGGKGGDTTNDIADAVKKFMESYKALKTKLENNNDENEVNAINTAMTYTVGDMDAEELYKALDSAMDSMELYIPQISAEANTAFTEAANKLADMGDFANKQLGIIDKLSDKLLPEIVKEFNNAKQDAEDYQDSINDVEADNQKNNFQQTFDREASNVKDIDLNRSDEIINELKSHRPYYAKLKEAAESFKFLTEFTNQPPDHQTILDPQGKKRFGTVEEYATKGVLHEISNLGYYLELPGYTHKGESLGLSSWKNHNDKPVIADNSLYKEIVKLSQPQLESEKKPAAKEQIMSNTSTPGTDAGGGNNMPVKVESVQESSGDDKEAFKKMAEAQTFSEYMVGNPECTAVNSQGATTPDEKMKVSGTCKTDPNDDNATAKNALDMIGAVSELMTAISSILEKGRDTILVTEYLTNNFSCHTTSMDGTGKRKNDAEMLSGMLFYEKDKDGKITKNVGYGTELEYILYGLDSEIANKAAAGGTIFAIRFVLNLIYSFTDAEIRNSTHSIALLAAGAFPFAVPIVQTVLHIGLSLAESAIDLTRLMQGAAVPLFKTKTTWECKLSNIVRTVVGEVAKAAANAAIDAAATELTGVITDMGNGVTGWTQESLDKVDNYVTSQLDDMKSMVKNAVLSPIREVVQECTLNIGTLGNMEAEKGKEFVVNEIKTMLDDALKKVIETYSSQSIQGDEENKLYSAILSVANNINTTQVAGIIVDNLTEFATAATGMNFDVDNSDTDVIQGEIDKLEKLLDEKLSVVTTAIDNTVDKYKDKLTELTTKYVNTAVDSINNGIESTADELKTKLNDSIASFVTGHKDSAITTGNGKATSLEHLLDMTYQDYMYVFVVIGYLGNRDAMLQRAAKLMQANCIARGGASDDYTLNTARTFFEIKTAASTSTVFYGAVFKDGELDMSGARKKYEFTHMAYMGY